MVSIAGFMSAKGSADKKVIKKVETMEKKSAHHNMVSAKAKAAFYNQIGVLNSIFKVFDFQCFVIGGDSKYMENTYVTIQYFVVYNTKVRWLNMFANKHQRVINVFKLEIQSKKTQFF